jgi:hypothetical protein
MVEIKPAATFAITVVPAAWLIGNVFWAAELGAVDN